MSDTLIIGLFTPFMIAVSAWVTIVLNGRVAARLAKQLAENSKKLEVVEEKLDANHKLANGHFTQLLKTTAELATAKERSNPTRK